MPRKPRSSEAQKRAIAIARQHWAMKPNQVNPQARLRIPAKLENVFAEQSSNERGAAWVDGYIISQNSLILYKALEALSGHGISIICDAETTLVVGQESFSADTTLEALLKAIAFYSGLEAKLTDLGLLE